MTGTSGRTQDDAGYNAVPPRAAGLLSLSFLGTAITPLTLALTGMLYLTGWTERNRLLKEFGVSASVVPEPIQNTLARGYTPLLVGIGLSLLALTLLLAIMNTTLKRLEMRMGEVSFFPFGASLGEAMRRARVKAIFGMICVGGVLLALLISHVSGIVSARVKAEKARAIVAAGCGRCFAYRVQGRRLVGSVLAQNDERTILLMNDGIALIKTEDISAVLIRPVRAATVD